MTVQFKFNKLTEIRGFVLVDVTRIETYETCKSKHSETRTFFCPLYIWQAINNNDDIYVHEFMKYRVSKLFRNAVLEEDLPF